MVKKRQLLKSEFESILAAIETFRSTCDNADLKSELDPWLKSLQDIASGGKAIIESIIAIQEKRHRYSLGNVCNSRQGATNMEYISDSRRSKRRRRSRK